MKKLLIVILMIAPITLIAQQFNVITFNIRYNNPGDGENAWPNRIEMVTSLLKFHEAELFGMQEALIGQIEDVQKEMPGFEWFGVGRDDGGKGGEFSPVFFDKSKFILLDKGTFWLSETPEKPSKGWDAALNRIVTWGKFQSKVTGKRFLYFNTHFDHVGVEARKNSATLIKKKIQEIGGAQGLPVIVTGDFNLTPDQEPIILLKKFLKDSREISETPPYGPVGTFNSFKIDAPLEGRIDYVFVNDMVKVLKYGTLTDYNHHRSPSDHLPVFVKVQLK